MNKKQLTIATALLLAAGSLFATPDKTELTQEAISIVKRFAGTLKPELKHALQEGGPTVAVEVCAIKAPIIAQNLAAESGWEVKRVSLKPRNPNAMPDAWETAALQALAERQIHNDGSDTLVYAELSEHQFRLMKAQPVEQICLTCHGTEIADDVTEALKKFYPEDHATGYSLGDIRGAISLSKSL